MWGLIIDLLWFVIFAVILAGVVWLVLYGLRTVAGIDIPHNIERAIWFIVLVLLLIFLITALVGGGSVRGPSFWPWRGAADGWPGLPLAALDHGAGAVMS